MTACKFRHCREATTGGHAGRQCVHRSATIIMMTCCSLNPHNACRAAGCNGRGGGPCVVRKCGGAPARVSQQAASKRQRIQLHPSLRLRWGITHSVLSSAATACTHPSWPTLRDSDLNTVWTRPNLPCFVFNATMAITCVQQHVCALTPRVCSHVLPRHAKLNAAVRCSTQQMRRTVQQHASDSSAWSTRILQRNGRWRVFARILGM